MTPAHKTDGGVLVFQDFRYGEYLLVVDSKTSGTSGGDFSAGAWRVRTLNTEKVNTIRSASLASNQIILPAGTYDVNASATAFDVARHQAIFTDGTIIISGTSEFISAADEIASRSVVRGRFTIDVETAFELQHRCESTRLANGFGVAAGSAFTVTEEIYSIVEIWRLP